MAKRTLHISSRIGPGVINRNTFVDVEPAYEFYDGTVVNWPAPKTFTVENGEVTIPGMEDTYAGGWMVWKITTRNLDRQNQPIDAPTTKLVTFQGTIGTTVQYPAMHKVDPAPIPEYETSVAQRAEDAAASANESADAAAEAIAQLQDVSATNDGIMAFVTQNASSDFRAALTRTGNRAVGQNELFFSIADWGAIGNGSFDNTTAIQHLLDIVPEYSTIWVPQGTFAFSRIIHTRPHVRISGPGELLGTLQMGSDTAITIFDTVVDVARIRKPNNIGAPLELRNAQILTIRTSLTGGRANLWVPPAPPAVPGGQSSKMIYIEHCVFGGADYGVLSENHSDSIWMNLADIRITNSRFTNYVDHIRLASCDGAQVTQNYSFYSPPQSASTVKGIAVFVGKSAGITINANHFFECGMEAVKLVDPQYFIISNNEMPFVGQRVPSPAITISSPTMQPHGTITGNVILDSTKHGIWIEGTKDRGGISIAPNEIDIATAPPSYYGASQGNGPMPGTQFRVWEEPPPSGTVSSPRVFSGLNIGSALFDNYKGRTYQTMQRLGQFTTMSVAATSINIVGPTNIASLRRSVDNPTLQFSGLLLVQSRPSDLSVEHKLATYLLLVSEAGENNYVVTQVGAAGLTAGGGTDHPSFTWSIVGAGNLRATPQGATAGPFRFALTAVGDLIG